MDVGNGISEGLVKQEEAEAGIIEFCPTKKGIMKPGCIGNVIQMDGSNFDGPWSFKNETIFIDLMEGEVAKGNRPTTTFTRTSWAYMKEQLIAKTGYIYTHEQMKNKYNSLRKIHKDFKKLLNDVTEKGWDPVLGTITLEEEQWGVLIKVNKRAKKFKKSGCPHYEKLTRIYGDAMAIRTYTHPSTKISLDSKDETRIESDAPTRSEGCGYNKDENQCECSTSKRYKRKREGLNDTMPSLFDALAENLKRGNEILEKMLLGTSSVVVNETSSKVDDFMDQEMNKCLEILNSMMDIDDEDYSKALKVLLGDASWRHAFLRIPESRRRGVIKYL